MSKSKKHRPSEACMFVALPSLLVPSTYSLLPLATHAWITKSPSPVLFLAVLPWIIYGLCYVKYRKNYLAGKMSASSFVVAHIATAMTTWLFKFLPVIDAGLSSVFFLQCGVLAFLFWRMIVSDPGRVTTSICVEPENGLDCPRTRDLETLEYRTNESFGQMYTLRGRYCHQCEFFVECFDHHCAAIQNCVGSKNHMLFILLLLAFILAEILYGWSCISCRVRCPPLFSNLKANQDLSANNQGTSLFAVEGFWFVVWQFFCEEPWVFSTGLFVSMQLLWQVPFLLFHLYCIAINMTTDEWVNWESYPRFYMEVPPEPGRPFLGKKFVNPYNHGVLYNFRTFLNGRI